MKRIIVSLCVCVCMLMGSLWSFAQTADPSQVVATVNDESILQSDVDEIITMFVLPQFQAQNPGQEFPEEQKAQLQTNLVTRLVMEKVLLQKAGEMGLTVDEEQLRQRVEMAAKQRPDISEDKWKELLTKEMLIQALIQQEVISKIDVSDEEVQKHYDEKKEQFQEPEQVQASHILIQVAQDATEEDKAAAKKKIEEILVLAKEGQDFAELAKEHSEGPSKDNGGDLGFFPRGAMVKPFEEVVFALSEGEISDVVETQFGYHIIKLTGKKEAREVPFEEVKEQLKQGLVRQKSNTEVMAWVEEMKAQADVEIVGSDKNADPQAVN
ncbi:peptidylprolyl isomerase [candidate division KSB3 bacterium]|uniref:Peptidylprolyl isomerase n=1 Tax=candidate division KSB3 bacterium TaxID=2044937 RepID=A0A2G6KE80_9BACT|nr:MAG: peptidylprolyl isomerase [candidate division KSB3 bacterium]